MSSRHQNVRSSSTIAYILLALALVCLAACSSSTSSSAVQNPPPPTSTGRTYSTRFTATENPISEGGNWTNGKLTGLDWSDVGSMPGLAYGDESGNSGFDDSTALLTGTWAANQMAQATVHSMNQSDNFYEEVELRLRSSLSAHRATGYEINFRCSKTGNAYTQIVRWNGALGDFTYLNTASGAKFGVTDGDTVKATMVGNVITVYINGTQVLQATDNTYSSGSPGMGFYLQGITGTNKDYGFTNFTASEI